MFGVTQGVMQLGRGVAAVPTLVTLSKNWVEFCDAHSWNLNKSSKSYSSSMASGHGFKSEGMTRWRFDEGVVPEVLNLVSRQQR